MYFFFILHGKTKKDSAYSKESAIFFAITKISRGVVVYLKKYFTHKCINLIIFLDILWLKNVAISNNDE